MGEMKVGRIEQLTTNDKPFFDMSKLPKENILDLYDKTVVTRINERLVMLQVREDKIIISPVGDGHRLNIEHVIDGRTLKITSELIPTLTISEDHLKLPMPEGYMVYHAMQDKTYVYFGGNMKFLHDGKPAGM